ncbi:hypothetical protein BDV96DRAFT_684698 [Lophiotrema nucula]|uniref:Uncharacterized protein n=1 Tax=Lophiotrema nucula TaxID=690887 RepID=A0A6A5ZKZ2_9PLEO|nr:hypothetical protein BDV96DRAFT_684698 [Lophiotrema nucula]
MADVLTMFSFILALASAIIFFAFYFRQKRNNREFERRIEALEHRPLASYTDTVLSPSNSDPNSLVVRTPEDASNPDLPGLPDSHSSPKIAAQAPPDEELSAALASALAEIHSTLSTLPSNLPTRLKTLETSLTDLQNNLTALSNTTTTRDEQTEHRKAAVAKLRDFRTTVNDANYKFAEMMQTVPADDVEGATLARLTALDIIVRHQQLALIPLFNNMRDQAYRKANGGVRPGGYPPGGWHYA